MIKPKITVMGSFVVDLMARAPQLPVPGETVKGSAFKLGPGGKGSNQAVAAQRLGAEVTMITKIGNDPFGEIALNNFINEGMNTSFIFRSEEHATGAALIMVDEVTGQNKIVVTLGACECITEEEIESARDAIESADIVLTQLETNLDAVEKTVDIAFNKGVKVVLNPAPAQLIPARILQKVYILTPNEIEVSILTGISINSIEDASKAARQLMKKGVGNVIITLGDKGAYVATEEKEKLLPCIDLPVVDTTGAGDAFNGGLVTALAEGKDIIEAVEFANAVASLSVTKIGTAPAMPYRKEVEEIMKER